MATLDKIRIVSKDNIIFDLDFEIAKQSELLKIEMENKNIQVELSNITSSVLEKIVAYMVYHKEVEDTKSWDKQFINKFTGNELIDLLWTADHLKIQSLLQLGKEHLITIIEVNDVSDIRDILNIKKDFNIDEEKNIQKDYEWICT